ncbi:MAG: TIGR04282 family arsenosugar biosynthesis glycosyltransferase [Betaproteobacteria bacterium]|nr:TIGR04282 family arsenosugar biosynthesis glycosyltransferase [Betaproteobacteria bacterium]
MSAAPALLVFAKSPVPGRVKTRLAATIGDGPAAAVYRELTAATLAHAGAARRAGVVCSVELWCAPDPDSAYFRQRAAAAGATRHRQAGADLGARMAHAITDALARHAAVLLIGTDCPLLDAAYLARASALLAGHDAVLGPAEDGGYVLVGATRPLPFAGVRWSSPHALADTEASFARAGLAWRTAPTLWDVDAPADLARWRGSDNAPAPAAP